MLKPWVRVLATFHNTPIFGRIWIAVAGLGIYGGLIALVDHYLLVDVPTIHAEMHTLLGLILGLLLVFRTNTSYDRWWEGRKLWGQLVNDSRNLAIKVQTCVRADEADKRRLASWIVAFAISLRDHLRGGSRLRDLTPFADADDDPRHAPAFIAERIYDQIERWRRADLLGDAELWFLDHHARALMDICGACERIQKTPISISYRTFIRQSIAIYLFTLPWGLIETFGFYEIPATMLLAYFMIGLETIAEEIEDPFGDSEDDLLLDELCRTIENSVDQIMRWKPAA